MILSKERGVCVINLLALFGENNDIDDIVESKLWINFDQPIMSIYYNSSISCVIPKAFELKKIYFAHYDIVI